MQKRPDPVKIRTQAEAYYRDMDYYCSEAIVKTINDEFGLGYPDSVIRWPPGSRSVLAVRAVPAVLLPAG